MQASKLFVGLVFHQREQFGVLAEEVLPEIGAALGLVRLEVAVDALFHALEQKASVVALEESIPVRTPDHLDDVPTRAAEDALKLVDNALIAADRTVEALQVAVDHEDQVVQLLPCGQADRAERVDLIRLTVADEGPYLAVCLLNDAAILQVAHEACLVDRVQRPNAHGDGGEAPEVGHQPGMRVGGEARGVAKLVAEVCEMLLAEAAFEEGAGVDAGRSMTLEVDEVAGLLAVLRAEEVVEADLEQGRQRRVGRNMT